MTVVRAVMFFLHAIGREVVSRMSALLAVLPAVIEVPRGLEDPSAISNAPVLMEELDNDYVARVLRALAVVRDCANPIGRVVALRRVGAVIVPLVTFYRARVHNRRGVSLSVVNANSVNVTNSPFSAHVLDEVGSEFAVVGILVIMTVAECNVHNPLSLVARIAVRVAVVALCWVLYYR